MKATAILAGKLRVARINADMDIVAPAEGDEPKPRRPRSSRHGMVDGYEP